jgi:bacterial/archaeal transporter family-2 protein
VRACACDLAHDRRDLPHRRGGALLPQRRSARQRRPWWAWIGGALGAVFVTSSVVVPVRIGAAAFFGIVVAAQLVTSVLADQYGWLSLEQKDVTPLRALGVGLLIGGALPVRLF